MLGRTVSHYRILEELGGGGMGVVFKAEDTRLGRQVALKFLPEKLSRDPGAIKRFQQEARAASALNHPNICTIHDIDEHEGQQFIVMELLEGQTLKRRIAGQPLPSGEILALATQIAEGLSAAHERGIIHRDIKPANLFVTKSGLAKVLDFGVAKLLPTGDDPTVTGTLTEVGAALGTLAYMAPEQLDRKRVDARTDIYALGCVLYEMATGQRPFQEERGAQLLDGILHRLPTPPRALNPALPEEVDRVILKCLEKQPAARYQSAKELLSALCPLTSPAAPPHAVIPSAREGPAFSSLWRSVRRGGQPLTLGIGVVMLALALLLGLNVGGLRERLFGRLAAPQFESIAVLPLANLSGDPGQEYFADGMTEELIMHLAQIGALRVTSRTSVMPYKEGKKSVAEIARELGVDWLVEGSVRHAAGRVRVTAQLIDARTDRHLWADNFERELHDVLALQSDVARAIAAQIRVRLSPEEHARLSRTRPVNPAAHEAYLRGITEEDFEKARSYFEQAIQLDPQYAPAYAGLADIYYVMAFVGAVPPQQAFSQMRQTAHQALELDETLAEAHGSLGLVKLHYDWDWTAAEREFQRALELNPSQAYVHHDYAHFLMLMNRHNEWVNETQRAVQLNPFSLSLTSCLAWHHLYAGQYQLAIEQAQRVVQRKPDYWWALINLGWAYAQAGRYKEAIGEFENSLQVWPDSPLALAGMGHTYALAGQRAEAERLLKQLTERAKSSFVPAYDIATVYAGLGEADQALAWLDNAYRERSALLVHVRWDPKFASLRSEPRFQALLRRMNFPE